MNRYVLPNGLVVIYQQIDHAISTSIGLWFRTGSRDEEPSEYGYAHFVEHMLFKGTTNNSARDLARKIDRVGGQHNAATNKEYTCYFINVVSDYTELALDVLSDMYYNSLFDEEEIEKEKGVILEEIRMYEDTPDEHIHDAFIYSMFHKHPLGHQILGTRETVAGITRESILNFYNKHYSNDNAVLVVTGSFNPSELEKQIVSYFNRERKRTAFERTLSVSEDRLFHSHITRELEQVHYCLGVEGIKKKSDKRWSLFLLSTILGGSMSSRLFQRLREDAGLCYSVYSFHSSYQDRGIFGIYCGTSSEKYEESLKLILDELSKMVHKGISDEELQEAKTFMKGNLALSLENIEVRMGQLARDEIQYGKFYTFKDIIDNIFRVSRDDFMDTARELFSNKRFSLISIGDPALNSEKELIIK